MPSLLERDKMRRFYTRWIRPYVRKGIHRQRLKLLGFVWGYWPLLLLRTLSLLERLQILFRFILIDWNILHAHKPCEIAHVCKVLAERAAKPGEVMVEAGCWKGGSSAKFSILCKKLGYRLYIYDSFQGIEPVKENGGYDISLCGEYSVTESELLYNLRQYGEIEVCHVYKGWFSETLATSPVCDPIRVVYVDCDLQKGTQEVLRGVIPSLVDDGCIFSQDYHFKPVRQLLHDPCTWRQLGRPFPAIKVLCGHLACVKFS